jgi:hypothetical protein
MGIQKGGTYWNIKELNTYKSLEHFFRSQSNFVNWDIDRIYLGSKLYWYNWYIQLNMVFLQQKTPASK